MELSSILVRTKHSTSPETYNLLQNLFYFFLHGVESSFVTHQYLEQDGSHYFHKKRAA